MNEDIEKSDFYQQMAEETYDRWGYECPIVVHKYGDPAYGNKWYAVIFQPKSRRWIPITSMGLQAFAEDAR